MVYVLYDTNNIKLKTLFEGSIYKNFIYLHSATDGWTVIVTSCEMPEGHLYWFFSPFVMQYMQCVFIYEAIYRILMILFPHFANKFIFWSFTLKCFCWYFCAIMMQKIINLFVFISRRTIVTSYSIAELFLSADVRSIKTHVSILFHLISHIYLVKHKIIMRVFCRILEVLFYWHAFVPFSRILYFVIWDAIGN